MLRARSALIEEKYPLPIVQIERTSVYIWEVGWIISPQSVGRSDACEEGRKQPSDDSSHGLIRFNAVLVLGRVYARDPVTR